MYVDEHKWCYKWFRLCDKTALTLSPTHRQLRIKARCDGTYGHLPSTSGRRQHLRPFAINFQAETALTAICHQLLGGDRTYGHLPSTSGRRQNLRPFAFNFRAATALTAIYHQLPGGDSTYGHFPSTSGRRQHFRPFAITFRAATALTDICHQLPGGDKRRGRPLPQRVFSICFFCKISLI